MMTVMRDTGTPCARRQAQNSRTSPSGDVARQASRNSQLAIGFGCGLSTPSAASGASPSSPCIARTLPG
jgi:hypothetical protein